VLLDRTKVTEAATDLYFELDKSSPVHHVCFKITFTLSNHLHAAVLNFFPLSYL
jgi:hypothetical protein